MSIFGQDRRVFAASDIADLCRRPPILMTLPSSVGVKFTDFCCILGLNGHVSRAVISAENDLSLDVGDNQPFGLPL